MYFTELNNIFNKSNNPKMSQTVEIYKTYYKQMYEVRHHTIVVQQNVFNCKKAGVY